MRLLWILVSGVNYLILLLCSVLAATGTTVSPWTTGVLSGRTSEAFTTSTAAAEKASSTILPARITKISNGPSTQPVSGTISTASVLFTRIPTNDNGRIGTPTSANTSKTPLGVTSSTQRPPVTNSPVILGNTPSTIHSSSATIVTPLTTRGTQPSSTRNTMLTDNIATASTSVSVRIGTTIPGTKTTHHPGKQLLKSWEIILISLAVTAAIVAGFIGCCYFCRTSSTSYSITSLP